MFSKTVLPALLLITTVAACDSNAPADRDIDIDGQWEGTYALSSGSLINTEPRTFDVVFDLNEVDGVVTGRASESTELESGEAFDEDDLIVFGKYAFRKVTLKVRNSDGFIEAVWDGEVQVGGETMKLQTNLNGVTRLELERVR